VVGAVKDTAVQPGVVAIGEVGLAGEIRPVSAVQARISEAARLGFETAIVPANSAVGQSQIRTVEVSDLRGAVRHAFVIA
jgi:DNA repair protein RadA/Sms